MRSQRLWRRLFLAYLWVPVILLLAVGLYGWNVVSDLYEERLNAELVDRARLCGEQIESLVTHRDYDQVDPACKRLGRAGNMRLTVILPSGRVVGDSHEDPRRMENHRGQDRPEVEAALAGAVGYSRRASATEREVRIYAAVPLGQPSCPIAVVRTSLPRTDLDRTLDAVRRHFLAAALLGILGYAALSILISRRMSRPLEQIKSGATRFAAGELDHRLPVVGPEEVAAVAVALNHMAAQLQERIETVLRQQEERDAMLSSMEEGVLAVDNQGTILSLNQTCATLLGDEPGRFQGRSVYEVIRKPDLLEFVEAAIQSGAPLDGEIQMRGLRDRWLIAHGTALRDSQRGVIGVLIVLHDITRLRHLEDVRRDFVANVSHELRTPITSLKGFVETLLDGALDDRDSAHRFLKIMLRQVNRLDAIISDLLALSRIEKGFEGQTIELAFERVHGVLRSAMEMCEKKAADKGVRIETICPEDLAAQLNAALLEQAVVNLLDNAVKYSDAGTTVFLQAERRDDQLVITVKDQGCGIEAKHLPRLFERFYRVDKARSRELGGTGLGLAIVKHIAIAHHGAVAVESAVGLGSTFTLRVPLAAPTLDERATG
ncbi:MAG: ATP-binding protein [Thermoguttaceae bacterium]